MLTVVTLFRAKGSLGSKVKLAFSVLVLSFILEPPHES